MLEKRSEILILCFAFIISTILQQMEEHRDVLPLSFSGKARASRLPASCYLIDLVDACHAVFALIGGQPSKRVEDL